MRKTLAIVNAAAGSILIITLVLVFSLDLLFTGSRFSGQTELNFAWCYSDGTSADLRNLSDDQSVITAHFNGESNRARSLCFMSRNISFSISLDGNIIYEFAPHLGYYYGFSYGSFLHCIQLPDNDGSRELTIEYRLLHGAGRSGFEEMMLEDTNSYLSETLRFGSARFLLCVISFFFGAFLFVFALVQHHTNGELAETMSLGVISMMLSLWEFPPAGYIQLLSGNPAAERAMNNLILILLPIPVFSFIVSITEYKQKNYVYAYISACVVNLIMQLCIVLTNTADYYDMLFISHIIIVGGIAMIINMIVRAVQRNKLTQEQKRFLIPSVIIVIITGIIDMIRYYSGKSTDTSAFSRLGMLIFILLLVYYEMKRLVEIQVLSSRAELMHRLATEDSLTGIKNRAGFNEYEQEIMKRKKGKCLFIHFDVNRLKKVNDTYGHAEGDRHIIAAASVLRDSFGEYGECFRVGGDEFFVILDSKNCDELYTKCIDRFQILQKKYNRTENPPVPLQLAYGMAEYNYGDGSPEKAEQLADSRMYEKKRQMKADERKRTTEAMLSRIKKKDDVREHASALYEKMIMKTEPGSSAEE